MAEDNKLAERTKANKLIAAKKLLIWAFNSGEYPNITKEMIDYLSPVAQRKKANCIIEIKPNINYEDFRDVYTGYIVQDEPSFRNKALLAFALITGARIGAIITMPLKCYIPEEKKIIQCAELGVETKWSKRIETTFVPLDEEYEEIFHNWYWYLISVKGFKPEDPLFPATQVCNIGKKATQVIPKFYSSSQILRGVIKKIFKNKGYDNVTPHKIRHLLVRLEGNENTTKNQHRAFYLNIGHSSDNVIFYNYGLPTADELNAEVRSIKFENLKRQA